MKINAILIGILMLAAAATAQNQPKMVSELITLPITIEESRGQFRVNWSDSAIRSSSQDLLLIDIEDLSMNNTDLHVQCRLNHREEDFSYGVSLQLETKDQSLIFSTPAEITTVVGAATSRTLIWKDLAEKKVEIGLPYLLLVRVDLYGSACATTPSFTVSDKMPHFGAYALGLGSIGAGLLFKREADQANNAYQEAWKNGDNEASLETARQDFRTYRNLVYTGLGMMVINSVIFYVRQKRYKKAKRKFDFYCSGKIPDKIHPRIDATAELSFSVRFNF